MPGNALRAHWPFNRNLEREQAGMGGPPAAADHQQGRGGPCCVHGRGADRIHTFATVRDKFDI